jgi:hypothetical protein
MEIIISIKPWQINKALPNILTNKTGISKGNLKLLASKRLNLVHFS